MIDKDVKSRVDSAIKSAFDKWALRKYENVFREFESADHDRKQKISEDFWDEDDFLVRRVWDIGFYRHVLKEIRSNTVIQKQRAVVLEACIKSIISSLGVTISDVANKPQTEINQTDFENHSRSYEKRNMQRIFQEKYSETFFKTPVKDNVKVDDERVSYYSSVFASAAPPTTALTEKAAALYLLETMQGLYRRDRVLMQFAHIAISTVLPEVLQDLIDFRKDCISILHPELGNNELARYLRDELGSFSGLFYQFYWYFSSIVAVEYFRHRKKEGRKNLLQGNYPFEYDETDARKAGELLQELIGSPERAFFYLSDAAFIFRSLKLHPFAITLYEECRKSKGISLMNQAVSTENVAIEYRDLGKFKLMLHNAKEALELYKKTDNQYRVCVCLKNIGEAEWMLGFKDRALDYFKEAELKSQKLDEQAKFGVLANIAASFRRIGDARRELEYCKKCLLACPEDNTETILSINMRISQLLQQL